MSSESEPVHLNNHHRSTLAKIFQHPVSHNLEWKDALSLLSAVAAVEEKRDGKYEITLGTETQSFDRPKHKDLSAQEVLDLRHILSGAGFGPPK
jgi:thiamine biosynthesis lipoprotein ApbE